MNDGFSLTQIILIYFFFFGSSFFYLLCFTFFPDLKLKGDEKFNHKYVLVGMYSFSKIFAIYLYLFLLRSEKPKNKETGIAMGSLPLFPGEQSEINYNEESAEVWNKTDETTLRPKRKPREPKKIHFLYFFIYGLIDVVSRFFLVVGAAFYPNNDVGNTIYPIFIVIIISYVITYIKYNYEYMNRHVTVGFIFYIFGTAFVCAADIYKKHSLTFTSTEIKGIIIGVVFVFLGEILKIILYYIHQNNVNFNKVEPLRQIGLEGLFGSSIMVVLLIILQFSKCSFDKTNVFHSLCMNNNMVENSSNFLSQAYQNINLLLWLIGFFISCIVLNILGIFVVKNTNALFLVLAENCKIIPLGIVFGFIQTSFKRDYILGMVGFSLMGFGCVLFNRILRHSCLKKKRPGKYKGHI